MELDEIIELTRNCDAVLIPVGTPVYIPAGTMVRLVQRLGGSYTVSVNANLVRIAGKDADALGFEVEQPDLPPAPSEGVVSQEALYGVLRTCFDPEIPVNIVDLGLVYRLEIEPVEGGSRVTIYMTLTAPGCGMGPFIVDDVRQKVVAVPGVREAFVDLVFDPPWDRSMMSDLARLQLGFF